MGGNILVHIVDFGLLLVQNQVGGGEKQQKHGRNWVEMKPFESLIPSLVPG